jgi:hypothetical protein
VSHTFRPSRPSGFVATGPSFYVWEERRSAALRAARELLPRPDAATITVKPASRPPKR